MSEKRPRPPSEDLAAWDAVARGVKPLAGRARDALPVPRPVIPSPAARPAHKPPQPAAHALPRAAPVEPAPKRQPAPRGLPPIEERIVRAIRRGQTTIDLRLDLHGETQIQAHKRLEQTLATAVGRGARVLLVVTGTGMRRRLDAESGRAASETPGVLRRMLPHWLAMPPLSDCVIGVSQAAPHHGGAGAFYILVRRARSTG